ncbi:MAG: hypothetical protein WA030_03630 [Candidatus Microsaccharimonas sp.]
MSRYKDGFKNNIYNSDSFYQKLLIDFKKAKKRIIVESPFITARRSEMLYPVIAEAKKKGATIAINTKPLNEHNPVLLPQVKDFIAKLQSIEVMVIMTVGHYRKLAIFDDNILSEY